jgi:short-subunit dehydrogenase
MLKPKLALITGASSGLGKALCEELAKRQIPLILVARDESSLKAVASSLAVLTTVFPVDLSEPEERQKLIQFIQEKKPDLIINNAGFGLYGPVLAHPLSETNQMIEVNIQALMQLTIEGAQCLIKNKMEGTIVNISSAAAFFSYPTFCVYAASKAFVNRFSEGLDTELKPYGIRVLTVCPGQIETGFRARASKNYPQEKDKITMPVQRAAKLVLKQIDKGKTLSIIDWRYRLLIGITKLLPNCLVQAILKRSLRKRHAFN